MKNLFAALGIMVSAIVFASCTGSYVVTERPAEVVYTRPLAPGPDYVWVGGEWVWAGGRYTWREGHWDRPRPGYRWQEGRWEQTRGGWRWHRGGWRH